MFHDCISLGKAWRLEVLRLTLPNEGRPNLTARSHDHTRSIYLASSRCSSVSLEAHPPPATAFCTFRGETAL